jgi:hypothetical protein
MEMVDRQRPTDRPVRPACLATGCTCKDARIVSTRRAAFFAAQARAHGETADRSIEPDPRWRSLLAPARPFPPPTARPVRLRPLTNEPSRTPSRGW